MCVVNPSFEWPDPILLEIRGLGHGHRLECRSGISLVMQSSNDVDSDRQKLGVVALLHLLNTSLNSGHS